MIPILHAARVESGNEKTLDLELLFNQVGGIFKPDEEAKEEDRTLYKQRYWPKFASRNMRTRERYARPHRTKEEQ